MEDDESGLHIEVLDNGIHQFRWETAERSAVDRWMAYNGSLYQQAHDGDVLCFLHLVESAQFPPLSYIVRKARQLQMYYPQHPATRSAILFRSRFFGGMINTLGQVLNRPGTDVTRFFQLEQREEAIAWLLEDNS